MVLESRAQLFVSHLWGSSEILDGLAHPFVIGNRVRKSMVLILGAQDVLR